jgi:hypothetical protein
MWINGKWYGNRVLGLMNRISSVQCSVWLIMIVWLTGKGGGRMDRGGTMNPNFHKADKVREMVMVFELDRDVDADA